MELLFGWTVPWWALLAGVLLGLVPAVALPAGVSANRLRTVRSDFGVRAGSRIRWIVEVLVLAVAGLSLHLLLSGGLTTGTGGGADVLVAAAPVLLTLAVCVLVIRLYPLPLQAIQRFVRRRRGAVGFLGAIRALRDPLVGIPLILATVTGVAVAMFSVVTLSTVSSGITIAGERAVGADLSVTGAFMTEDLVAKARKVPGVQAATTVGLGGTLTINSGSQSLNVTMYFADTASFAEVQRAIPGAPNVPGQLTRTAAGIPVVVSDSVRSQLPSPTAQSGNGKTLNIVGTGPFPTGLGIAKDWMLVDTSVADSLLNTGGVPDHMLIREPHPRSAAAGPAGQTRRPRRGLATGLRSDHQQVAGRAVGRTAMTEHDPLFPDAGFEPLHPPDAEVHAPARHAAPGPTLTVPAATATVDPVPASPPSGSEALLVAHDVTRVFKTPAGDRVANNHIDLSVRPGELVVLAGPSGAGKTTLLNLLAGLDRPTSGQVMLAGQNYAQSSDRQLSQLRREYIGYVFQSFGLLPMLSARENVEVPLRLLRMPAAERDARVDEVLAEVELTGHGEQRPYELSGGQQQRVSLARALVARPRLLLADEPTAQLDSATAGTILELIQHLVHRLGVAAVVTTHDESLMALADRVVLLHDGTAINAPAQPVGASGRHSSD